MGIDLLIRLIAGVIGPSTCDVAEDEVTVVRLTAKVAMNAAALACFAGVSDAVAKEVMPDGE